METRIKLFNRWKNLNHKIQNLASIIQNDVVDVTPEQLKEWKELSREFIDVVIMLRSETVDYVVGKDK